MQVGMATVRLPRSLVENMVKIIDGMPADEPKPVQASLEAENSWLRQLMHLASEDEVFFASDGPAVLLNDTFSYASADAERVTEDQVPLLADLYQRFDHAGVVAWAAWRRGCEPIKELRTETYNSARAFIERTAEEP